MLKFLQKPFPLTTPSKIIRNRKIDNLYQNLPLISSTQTKISTSKIKKFYYQYINCIKNREISELEPYLEPRFFFELKNYLKKTKKNLKIKKIREQKIGLDEIKIEFNGSIKIFGISKSREENDIYNNYTFIKNDDLLEYININKIQNLITNQSEKKNSKNSQKKKNAEKILKTEKEMITDKFWNFFKNQKLNDEENFDYNKMTLKKKINLKYKSFQKRDFLLLEEFVIKAPLYFIPQFSDLKVKFEDEAIYDIDNFEKDLGFVEHFVRIETWVDSKDNERTLRNKGLFVVDFDDFMFGNPHYNCIDFVK